MSRKTSTKYRNPPTPFAGLRPTIAIDGVDDGPTPAELAQKVRDLDAEVGLQRNLKAAAEQECVRLRMAIVEAQRVTEDLGRRLTRLENMPMPAPPPAPVGTDPSNLDGSPYRRSSGVEKSSFASIHRGALVQACATLEAAIKEANGVLDILTDVAENY